MTSEADPCAPPNERASVGASRGASERLCQVVRQSPLLETRLSLQGLDAMGVATAAPTAVFFGVGLCTPVQLSRGIPIDLLGLLLPAERIRRAVGARRLVVLVADEHAHLNRFSPTAIEEQSRETLRLLWRLRDRLGLPALTATRASQLRRQLSFRRVRAGIDQKAPPEAHGYFKAEVADVAWLAGRWPRFVKVGWAIASAVSEHRRDEVAFDQCYRRWCDRPVRFVYCKAGRRLDNRARKTPPYVATDLSQQIILRPGEDVGAKLRRAERWVTDDTLRGVRKHLKAITRAYAQLVHPVQGPLEQRVQQIIDHLFASGPG